MIRICLPCLAAAVFLSMPVLAQQPDGARRPPTGMFGRPGLRRGPSEEDKERARTRVGMSKEQQAQLETVFEEAEKRNREIFEEMRGKYARLHAVYDDYEFDRQQQRTLMREIAGLWYKLVRVQADTEEKTRKILSKEQFEKFRALLKEMMPPRPPGPRGGGRTGSAPQETNTKA